MSRVVRPETNTVPPLRLDRQDFLAVALIADAAHYVLHRLFHSRALFWVHKSHHKSIKTVVCSNAMDNDPLDLILVVELPVALASWIGGRSLVTQVVVLSSIGLWGVFIHQSTFGNHMDHHKQPNRSFAPIFPWLDLMLGTTASQYSGRAKAAVMLTLALAVLFLAMPLIVDPEIASWSAIPFSLLITASFITASTVLEVERGVATSARKLTHTQ